MEKLAKIQKELKSPKNLKNDFGNYKYRSAEQILENIKPLLDGAIVTITDDVIVLGTEKKHVKTSDENGNPVEKDIESLRVYVKATATFEDGDYVKSVSAYAREQQDLKGMTEGQITGATSSYARKYALNGLFCIDNSDDLDAINCTPRLITEEQKATLAKMGAKFDDLAKHFGLESIDDMTEDKAAILIKAKQAQNNAKNKEDKNA